MPTRQQIGFVSARRVANFGLNAAPMVQLVAFGGADDSWLIGFPDAYNKPPIPHLQKSHYGLARRYPRNASCSCSWKPGSSGSAHLHQLPPFMTMLKQNRKGRATTLSKTLLTAGLLGGAALSTLGAGSAQAAWDLHEPLGYICTVLPTLGGAACEKAPAPGATTDTPVARPGGGLYPEDKLLTLLDWSDLRADDTIAFTKQAASWEVDLDFSLDRIAGDSGWLNYKIDITDPDYTFKDAQLSSLLSQIPATPVGPFTVTKSIYLTPFDSLGAPTGPSILTLTNNELPPVAGTLVASGLISGGTIYVRDEWTIPAGSNTTLDAIQNNYTQDTDVPGPLPLLGAGAAFGFSRRIRSRIKGARLV